MSARRVIAMAERAERRAAPAGRYGLGARVLSAREMRVVRFVAELCAYNAQTSDVSSIAIGISVLFARSL